MNSKNEQKKKKSLKRFALNNEQKQTSISLFAKKKKFKKEKENCNLLFVTCDCVVFWLCAPDRPRVGRARDSVGLSSILHFGSVRAISLSLWSPHSNSLLLAPFENKLSVLNFFFVFFLVFFFFFLFFW